MVRPRPGFTIVPFESSAPAEVFLLKHLTPEQQQTWTTRYYFDIRINRFKTYRIWRRGVVNVERLSSFWLYKKQYCVTILASCPIEDMVLAQKLLLETNEKRFRAIAGRRYWEEY